MAAICSPARIGGSICDHFFLVRFFKQLGANNGASAEKIGFLQESCHARVSPTI